MKKIAILFGLIGLSFFLLGCGETTAPRKTEPEAAIQTAEVARAPRKTDVWLEEAIGGFDEVHLYVPKTTSPVGKGRSLLLVLHGCMQKPSAFTTANLDVAADEFGAVIAAPFAKYKQGYDCWAFWRKPTRTGANDYALLLSLVEELVSDPDLQIDRAQVYITGISSGGTFAMQTACMAPEIFAGMGIYAAPSPGTPAYETLKPGKAGTVDSTVASCFEFAGEHKYAFANQLMNAATGENDPLTNPLYAMQNAQAMGQIYEVAQQDQTHFIDEENGADETRWKNGRVSHLSIRSVGHDWSGGEKARGSFISPNGLNYTRYLLRFFSAGTLRAL